MRGATDVFSSETVDDLENTQFFFLENSIQVPDVNKNKIEHQVVSSENIQHFCGKNIIRILSFNL